MTNNKLEQEFYTSVVQHRNKMLVRGIDVDGNAFIREDSFSPKMYIQSDDVNSKFKGIDGTPLQEKTFKTISELRKYKKQFDDVSNFRLDGQDNYIFQYISETYPQEIKYNPKLIRVFNIDIEVESSIIMDNSKIKNVLYAGTGGFPHPLESKHPITLIGIEDSITKRYKIFGFGNGKDEYTKKRHLENIKRGDQGTLHPDQIDYITCDNERDLLVKFLQYWITNYPDVVTGWNTNGFDFPYIAKRIEIILGEDISKRLSPHGLVDLFEDEDKYGNIVLKCKIKGINMLDYMDLYKKFNYVEPDNYKLDTIASTELGETKLSYEESGNLRNLFRDDIQRYTEYNAVDILCVSRLDNKLKFIDLVYQIAYYAKVPFETVLGTIGSWDSIIYNHLKSQNIIIPQKKINKSKTRKFAGAYVRNPITGKHKWVSAFDLNSLYPHLIMNYNIGVETLVPFEKLPDEVKEWRRNLFMYDFDEDGDPVVDGDRGRFAWLERLSNKEIDLSFLKKYNLTFAPSGEFFETGKTSFLSYLMKDNYDKRKIVKKCQLRYEQELIWMQGQLDGKSFSEITTLEQIENNRTLNELDSKFFYNHEDSIEVVKNKIFITSNEIARTESLQMALKILLNSGYGALGNEYSRYFDLRIAESITLGGQANIVYIANKINDEVNKLNKTDIDNRIYGDTDSVYISFVETVNIYTEKFKQKYGKEPTKTEICDWLDNCISSHFEPYIERVYTEFGEYQNTPVQAMKMAREVISDESVFIRKKGYIMNVLDNEGVRYSADKPKVKVTGMDAIRSSTPEVCRHKLKEAYKVMLFGEESSLQEFISEFKKEHRKLSAHQIAKNSSANNLLKYTCEDGNIAIKGTPAAVKGALYYNDYSTRILGNEFEPILEGEKVKYLCLKEPNLLRNKAVSFPVFLDKKLGLDEDIDYEKMFNDTFIKPLEPVMGILGWTAEPVGTLEDMFSMFD